VSDPNPATLQALTMRLGHLAESLSLSTDPVQRLDLLKEFRILLDLTDALIVPEFPVERQHLATRVR
jgi:hypothetical protein